MTIRQGDIYFVDLEEPRRHEPGFPHYVVVLQSNDFNDSDIGTVVVCCLTTTLTRANSPGNVLLYPDEGGLPEHSAVNVSQLIALDREDLKDRRGALDYTRMRDVIAGVRLVLEGERGLP